MLGAARWCARAALLAGALSVVEGPLIRSNPGYYDFDASVELLILVVEGAALLAALAGWWGCISASPKVTDARGDRENPRP